MIHTVCFRHEFLRKIGKLWSGIILLSAILTACPTNDYTSLPTVVGYYFDDANTQKIALRANMNVPVHTQFTFIFSRDMCTDFSHVRPRLTFVDSHGIPVDFSMAWIDVRTLRVTPSSNLLYDTDYSVTINNASDSEDNPLNPYVNQTASFRTVGS